MQRLDLRRRYKSKLEEVCVLVGRTATFLYWEPFARHVLPGCVCASAVLLQRRALAAVISVEFLVVLKATGEN